MNEQNTMTEQNVSTMPAAPAVVPAAPDERPLTKKRGQPRRKSSVKRCTKWLMASPSLPVTTLPR